MKKEIFRAVNEAYKRLENRILETNELYGYVNDPTDPVHSAVSSMFNAAEECIEMLKEDIEKIIKKYVY